MVWYLHQWQINCPNWWPTNLATAGDQELCLVNWMNIQRQAKERNIIHVHISNNQIYQLYSIQFIWGVREYWWNTIFEAIFG